MLTSLITPIGRQITTYCNISNNCLLAAVYGNSEYNPSNIRSHLVTNIKNEINKNLERFTDFNDQLAFLHYLDFNYDLGMQNEIGCISNPEDLNRIKEKITEDVQKQINKGSMLDILVSGQILADQTNQALEFNTNFQNDTGQKLIFLLKPKNENKLTPRVMINYDHQRQHFKTQNSCNYFSNKDNYIDDKELINQYNKIAHPH